MPLSGADPVCVVSAAPPTAVSGGLAERLDLARRALERDLAGQRDQRREVRERHVPERLEELLVRPAVLTRLLVEVDRHLPAVLEQLLEVAQQGLLLLVTRRKLARQLDLVEAEADIAPGPGVCRDVVLRAPVLGHRERHALLGGGRQRAAPKLRAHPCVPSQRGG